MTKKLYELISNTYGSKFVLKGVELTLSRVTVGKLIELENQGQDIQSLMNIFESKPASVSTKLSWLLFDEASKAQFDNDYANFIACLDMGDIEVMGQAVIEAINNSKPVGEEKNVTGVSV